MRLGEGAHERPGPRCQLPRVHGGVKRNVRPNPARRTSTIYIYRGPPSPGPHRQTCRRETVLLYSSIVRNNSRPAENTTDNGQDAPHFSHQSHRQMKKKRVKTCEAYLPGLAALTRTRAMVGVSPINKTFLGSPLGGHYTSPNNPMG